MVATDSIEEDKNITLKSFKSMPQIGTQRLAPKIFTPNTKGIEIRAKSNVRITKSFSIRVMNKGFRENIFRLRDGDALVTRSRCFIFVGYQTNSDLSPLDPRASDWDEKHISTVLR